MPGSRIGHTSRRHPLCPHCGYDLVATVADEGRVCPECGREFRREELPRAPAPDEWTPARGLLRLVLAVTVRSAVCLPAWVGLLVLASILCAWGDRAGSRTEAVLVWLLTTDEGRSRSGESFNAPSFCAERGLVPGWPRGKPGGPSVRSKR